MIDPFGRAIKYLRFSVTDRCDFRCTYCLGPAAEFFPRREVLSIEETERLCRIFISLGIEKIRITGGEPLIRRGVIKLIQTLGQELESANTENRQEKTSFLKELVLTTNGGHLAEHAVTLKEAGVLRVNVSLDTLDPVKFKALTGGASFEKVMSGIMAAKAAGLKVKINAVALKGVNEYEFPAMINWCGEHGFDLCLIEVMPLGGTKVDREDQFVSLAGIKARLQEEFTFRPLSQPSDRQTAGPARYEEIAETGQKIGFITPLSQHFCESCNRVRLTCNGRLYFCLGQDNSADLKEPLRAGLSDAEMAGFIRSVIRHKPQGHNFDLKKQAVSRPMSLTGG